MMRGLLRELRYFVADVFLLIGEVISDPRTRETDAGQQA